MSHHLFFFIWQMLDKTSTSFESFCCVGPGTLWITVLLGRGGDTSRGWHQRWLENILKKLWWMEVYNWFIAGKHHQSNWCSIVTITGQKNVIKLVAIVHHGYPPQGWSQLRFPDEACVVKMRPAPWLISHVEKCGTLAVGTEEIVLAYFFNAAWSERIVKYLYIYI